jgi:hypothetical protein
MMDEAFRRLESNDEGVAYPPLFNKFHFEAKIADEYTCKHTSEGYFIHRVTIVGDYEECSAAIVRCMHPTYVVFILTLYHSVFATALHCSAFNWISIFIRNKSHLCPRDRKEL